MDARAIPPMLPFLRKSLLVAVAFISIDIGKFRKVIESPAKVLQAVLVTVSNE